MSPTNRLTILAPACFACACLATTLLATSPAFAQTEPAPPPAADQAPPPSRPYPPPPPPPIDQTPYPQTQYPPPPPGAGYPTGHSYLEPPSGYYPGAGIYRPISFSVGLGPSALVGPKSCLPDGSCSGVHDLALSYNLFRLGFGVARNLSFIISFEGAGTSSISPQTGESSWLSQSVLTGGLQVHILPPLYLRGGIGAGWVNESTNSVDNSLGGGIAFSGAVGFEFVQTMHTALALEAAGSVAKYSGNEVWGMAGVNLAVSFF
jgi:hypothetical protein